jgi:hypothetical protein
MDMPGYVQDPGYASEAQFQTPGEPAQPNIIVVYPQQVEVPAPVPQPAPPVREPPKEESRTREPVPEPASVSEPSQYLIAFRDHTIYAAVAYWVDGGTLHYFTSGNTHNQVSLSLVDRELTERLNRESGLDLRLPEK